MPLSREQVIEIAQNIARERSLEMAEETTVVEEAKIESVECNCKVNLVPMEEFVKVEDPQSCRPCMIGPVANWYFSELDERGKTEQRDKLEKAVNGMSEEGTESVVAVCKVMDEIKSEVDDDTRKRLLDFDCAAQSYDPADVIEETPDS